MLIRLYLWRDHFMKAGCTEGLLKIIYRSGTLPDTVEYAEFNCGKCTLLYCRVFFIFCSVLFKQLPVRDSAFYLAFWMTMSLIGVWNVFADDRPWAVLWLISSFLLRVCVCVCVRECTCCSCFALFIINTTENNCIFTYLRYEDNLQLDFIAVMTDEIFPLMLMFFICCLFYFMLFWTGLLINK